MRFTDGRKWFHEKRFGMFIHWGIYAQGGIHEQEQWRCSVPAEQYEKYASLFNPVKFDPVQWLDMIQENGMEYMVFTAKHHDGFCMWDTGETPYNIMNTPYKKDIVGMLAEECHKRNFPLEIYYSCVDWHHKAYPNLGRHHEIKTDPAHHNMEEYMTFLKNQIRELCSNYGAIHGIWWDMNVPEYVDESVHDLIRSLQPCAIINNRGYGKGDYSTPERSDEEDSYLPFANPVEACDSISMNSWGYRKDDDYFSIHKLKRQIAFYTGLGGNFLLNAGPGPDGLFPAEALEILGKVGQWHGKVKEALNAPTCPGVVENREILCTGGGKELNLIVLDPPLGSSIRLKGLDQLPEKAVDLTTGEEISFTLESPPYALTLPPALRLRSLPVEKMYGEIAVIKLIFREEVIHPIFPVDSNVNTAGILKDE